jgi:hypothetical protein
MNEIFAYKKFHEHFLADQHTEEITLVQSVSRHKIEEIFSFSDDCDVEE